MGRAPPPELTRLLGSSDPASVEAAWSTFLERYSPLLLRTAHSLGGGHDAAMDRYSYLIAELNKDDFKRLRTYVANGRSQFTTWLVVVSRRLCYDHHRRRYGRARRSGDDSSRGARTSTEVQLTRRRLADLIASRIDPSELRDPATGDAELQVRAAQLSAALWQALDTLPARDRLLLRLRFEDGASVREITQAMRYPSVFHVYRRLKAVLMELRAQLGERGIDDPSP